MNGFIVAAGGVVAAGLGAVGAAHAWSRTDRSRMIPPPPAGAGADYVRAYLRHPIHKQRCLCREYGLVLGGIVLDDGGEHRADRCQPARERIA